MDYAKKLKEVVAGMLKENTGAHFLDSGGAYGRNWERNQSREFENEKACQVEIFQHEDGDLDITVSYNLYHFMVNFLEVDETTDKLNGAFKRFAGRPENEDKGWLELMEGWAAKVDMNGEMLAPTGFNTYNYETLLSQVLQGEMFQYKDDTYVLLQVHGGCDVRGGYTAPYVFKVREPDYFHLAMSDVHAACTGQLFDPRQCCFEGMKREPHCGNNWFSDDSGCHWYFYGCTSDEKPLAETTEYDEEAETLRCKDCGGEIHFSVNESW